MGKVAGVKDPLMQVRHERPMSDLAFDVTAPLSLRLPNGDDVVIRSWSLSGFQVPENIEIFPQEGELSIPFQGVDVGFPVAWSEPNETGHCTWRNLTGRQRETLALFYKNLLNGRMAATDEIITALDTPVDLVPMGESEEEAAEATSKAAPRSLRVVVNSLMYILAAVFIFGFVGHQVWTRLTSVPLTQARIIAPVQSYHAGDDAYVEQVRVQEGDLVEAGDVLVELSDPNLGGKLEEVRGDIKKLETRLERLNERERVLREDWARQRARLAQAHWAYFETLIPPQYPSLASDLVFQKLYQDLVWFEAGTSELGRQYLERFEDLADEREGLEWDLRRLRRERGNYGDLARSLNVIASEDGVVRAVSAFEDQFVQRGQALVDVEAQDARFAQAWVSESRAAALYQGMPVTVTHNLLGDRQARRAVISQLEIGADPTFPDRYGVLVTVAFPTLTIEETRVQYLPNTPVSIKAQRPTFLSRFIGAE